MFYFTEIMCTLAELCVFHFFSKSLFIRKNNHLLPLLTSYACLCSIILSLSFLEQASIAKLTCSTIGFIIILLVLFKVRFLSALFASLAYMSIYALTDVLVITGFSIFGIDIDALTNFGYTRTLFIIISHLVRLGIFVCLSILNKHKRGTIPLYVLIPFIPSWLTSIVLCCTLVVQAYNDGADFHPIYLLVILGFLYTCILIIYFVNRIREQDRLKHESELQEHHYLLEKEYYEQFHAQQEQTRALWHDISKYLKAIQSLVGETDSKKAEENLTQLQTMLNEIHGVVDVNNRVVNVILNEYMNLAKSNGVELKLDVQVSPDLFVSATDLYVLLGNTLDNSLNACAELNESDRYIYIQLKQHNDILYYRIENPYNEDYLNKKRYGIHGYGLRNVEICASKYGGFIDIATAHNTFVINVTMNAV